MKINKNIMKLTKREITTLSKYLWKHGHGSKMDLALKIECYPSEISRLLGGGTMAEEKIIKIKQIIRI